MHTRYQGWFNLERHSAIQRSMFWLHMTGYRQRIRGRTWHNMHDFKSLLQNMMILAWSYFFIPAQDPNRNLIAAAAAAVAGFSTFPQVTHSQKLKMNFEGNKTVKSYFTCSLSSLLGFWVVLEPFQGFFDVFSYRKKKNTNGSKTSQNPRRDYYEQEKYDLTVLVSPKLIFNLWEWVSTCALSLDMAHVRPGSNVELHMNRTQCKWAKAIVWADLHWVRLMWSSTFDLGLRAGITFQHNSLWTECGFCWGALAEISLFSAKLSDR